MNFFSRVTVGEDARHAPQPGNSQPGAWIELRAEMNVLVVLIDSTASGWTPA